MDIKLKTVPPTSFPEGVSAHNSGVGMLQLPEGSTKTSGDSPIAAVGVVMNGTFPGERPQSVRLDSNWLKDPRFRKL